MTDDAEINAVLARVPSHFLETATAIASDDSRLAMLTCLCELLTASLEHVRRELVAAQDEFAALRRARLRLVVSEPTRNEKGA